MISSDWHLGHKNIHKFRTQFETAEHHHEFVIERVSMAIQKEDTLILLGDIVFDAVWLQYIDMIKCRKKIIIIGNHDTEHVTVAQLAGVFDEVHGMLSRRNTWFTHCPIHPSEFRNRDLNIHGHTHERIIKGRKYFNACLERTDYKPISYADIKLSLL